MESTQWYLFRYRYRLPFTGNQWLILNLIKKTLYSMIIFQLTNKIWLPGNFKRSKSYINSIVSSKCPLCDFTCIFKDFLDVNILPQMKQFCGSSSCIRWMWSFRACLDFNSLQHLGQKYDWSKWFFSIWFVRFVWFCVLYSHIVQCHFIPSTLWIFMDMLLMTVWISRMFNTTL